MRNVPNKPSPRTIHTVGYTQSASTLEEPSLPLFVPAVTQRHNDTSPARTATPAKAGAFGGSSSPAHAIVSSPFARLPALSRKPLVQPLIERIRPTPTAEEVLASSPFSKRPPSTSLTRSETPQPLPQTVSQEPLFSQSTYSDEGEHSAPLSEDSEEEAPEKKPTTEEEYTVVLQTDTAAEAKPAPVVPTSLN